jgi:hypothetical protein
MACPFETLGLERAGCTKKQVLHAWRRAMLVHHPDKTGMPCDARVYELSFAKDRCMCLILGEEYRVEEREFVQHINRILQTKTGWELDMSRLIQSRLDEFMYVRAVDAMEWVIMCAISEREFEQCKDDEIPVLCKYYESFIGRENWTEEDNTLMTVLGKYDEIKAKGLGNFARLVAGH